MIDMKELQASITLSRDAEQIKANRDRLTAAREAISAQLAAIDALNVANQKMCTHRDRYSSNWCGRDPGGGGCHTCGKSW